MERMGRYSLGRLLGAGGAGEVYRATLHGPGGLEKAVALKMLYSGSEALRREARIGGLLRHRHLVDVYEISEEDGKWFCAMEWCQGGSLWSHAPLSSRAVVEVGLQICEALHYAHDALNLVHLDIKPENLLLSEGIVKVADLGIAVAEGFSGDGQIRGTPGYMAPEQWAGRPVDARTDVYAVGMTLVALAVGYPVGMGEEGTLGGVSAPTQTWTLVDGEGEAPVEEASLIPTWLLPVVERCIAPDPEARWPDMEALAEALGGLAVEGLSLRESVEWELDPTPTGPQCIGAADSFHGRVAECAEVEAALASPGVLVLKGPAGIGKSRLAIVMAERWGQSSGRDVWFCNLTEVVGLDGLLAAIGSVLDVPPTRGDSAARVAKIGETIAERGALLLILDNFEQIADLAPIVVGWQLQATEARIVITSRRVLPVSGIRQFDLAPLDGVSCADLLVSRAAERGVVMVKDSDLHELAQRLDGIPLALELAAGRLGVLSVRDILERLEISMLRCSEAGRHGTLAGALDWSWDLLSVRDRLALSQLSVFAGGFTAEAAEGGLELPGASVLEALSPSTPS